MKLNVFERLNMLQILPKESNFATLKIVNDLQSEVGITEEEFKEFDLKQEGEQLKWNEKGKEEKEIKCGEKAFDIVKGALEKLDKEEKITVQLMSLYEKFVEGKYGDDEDGK